MKYLITKEDVENVDIYRVTVSAMDDELELEEERGRVLCFGGVFFSLKDKDKDSTTCREGQ